MSLIDTHTHLYMPEFAGDDNGAEAVRRAIDAGVHIMIFPNVDATTVEPMKALAARFPCNVRMAMGLHPTEVRDGWREQCQAMIAELDKDRYVAVGEIGMDLYWDAAFAAEQQQAFDMQVAEAERRGLPVIIHCREGLDPTLEVLQGHPSVRAVMHSFGGTAADVDKIRRTGDYYFGINGIVTFKNCKVRDVLPDIGIERILLETDSPYLAPVPHRGKRNESAFITNTAAHVAAHMGMTCEEVARITSANARTLFPL